MRVCPQCNSQVSLQGKTCNICGLVFLTNPLNYSTENISDYIIESIQESEKICPSCHTANKASWAFCCSCGSPLAKTAIKTAIKIVTKPPLASKPAIEPVLKNNLVENRSVSPANNRANLRKEKTSKTKAVTNSLGGLIFCAVCGQANPKDTEVCLSCQNPTTRTLAMGSKSSHPRLQLMKDSGESESYDITGNDFVIGRTQGNITFPEDNYMSSYHAHIVCRDQKYFLIDEQSKNGVYKRIKKELILKNGDIVLVGKQVFRFEK